jgi:hypothetical protein
VGLGFSIASSGSLAFLLDPIVSYNIGSPPSDGSIKSSLSLRSLHDPAGNSVTSASIQATLW